jgi:peptidoglycan/LPS O-acetylase OafA/YrhL
MKNRLVELDALRGIAALFVVLFHFSIIGGFGNQLLRLGVTGVDLFFLISGYVIFMTLSKIKSSYEFIVSRLLRLYPAYLVMIFITLLLIFIFKRTELPGLKNILGNLTMLQPLFRIDYIDDSYWTLTVEMEFYLFMLLLYITGKLKDIERICTLLLSVIFVYYVISSRFFPDSIIYILPKTIFPIISHLPLFFSGILFYNMKTDGMKLYRHLLVLLCFVFNLFLFNKSGRSHFFIGLDTYTLVIGLYFGLFYLFVFGKLRFLNLKPLLFLGNISYGLYLIHQEAGKILYQYIIANKWLNPFPAISLLFFLMILIASFVTYCIEKPVKKLKKYLYRESEPAIGLYVNDKI